MIAIGSDHAGFDLKQEVMRHLTERGLEYRDYGTESKESCDYPVFGERVAKAVASGEAERGIVICGSGIGISIAANKVKGIRCALCTNDYEAELSRRHNNANILAMGGRIIGPDLAKKIVDVYLDTPFDGGRHARRVALLDNMG